MSKLFEQIGQNDPNYLLAGAVGMDVIGVPMKPGSGIVKRGTIVYRDASTGLWAPAAAANAVITNQLAVLDETVDATGVVDGSKTIAADARAYRAGHFVRGRVTLASDAAVTAAVETVMRAQGIVLDQMVSTGTFDNSVTTPTGDGG